MGTPVSPPMSNGLLNTETILRRLREVIPSVDVLVVDDTSPDGTEKRAQAVSEELGQIHVLSRPVKSGLGGAYRAGFTWGLEHDFELFVEIDCDFSHDPRALPSIDRKSV